MPNQTNVSSNATPPSFAVSSDQATQGHVEEGRTVTNTKARKKLKAPRDADYRAAWKACCKPWVLRVPNDKPLVRGELWDPFVDGEKLDMRAMLDKALKSGWSIQGIKAYAYGFWRHLYGEDRYDRVTTFAWRLAVYDAAYSAGNASRFLTAFSANPERYAHVK